jgi:hypothetical protein
MRRNKSEWRQKPDMAFHLAFAHCNFGE